MQYGKSDLARYTFLREAGDFVRDNRLTLVELASVEYERAVERAFERVKEAITRREVSDGTTTYSLPGLEHGKGILSLGRQDQAISGARSTTQNANKDPTYLEEIEIVSFPIALMFVKATKLDHLINIYSLAEAKRTEKILEQVEKSTEKFGDRGILVDLFGREFGIALEKYDSQKSKSEELYAISVPDYLSRAIKFHKPEWKLSSRLVKGGKVIINRQDLIRLVREEIQAMIKDRLKETPSVGKLPEKLAKFVEEIVKIAPPPPLSPFDTIALRKVAPEDYPPCVRHALDMLGRGENVPHYGRFLMATYLLSIGKSVDEVVAIFPKAPDFKQSVTRYQVEHLAGLKGGRTRYRVPSCRTLQTHQFCFMDKVRCYGIANPLQFPSKLLAPSDETNHKKKEEEDEDDDDKRRRKKYGEKSPAPKRSKSSQDSLPKTETGGEKRRGWMKTRRR